VATMFLATVFLAADMDCSFRGEAVQTRPTLLRNSPWRLMPDAGTS
jgi:hypothetical protein